MGSFTSKPVVVGGEDPDSDLQFPACSPDALLGRCMEELGAGAVPPLPRPALPSPQNNTVTKRSPAEGTCCSGAAGARAAVEPDEPDPGHKV